MHRSHTSVSYYRSRPAQGPVLQSPRPRPSPGLGSPSALGNTRLASPRTRQPVNLDSMRSLISVGRSLVSVSTVPRPSPSLPQPGGCTVLYHTAHLFPAVSRAQATQVEWLDAVRLPGQSVHESEAHGPAHEQHPQPHGGAGRPDAYLEEGAVVLLQVVGHVHAEQLQGGHGV